MRYLILAASLALTACASNGTDTQNVGAKRYGNVNEAKANSNRDDLICTYETKPGSHMKTATCLTADQRDARAEQATRQADELQRRAGRNGSRDTR